MSVHGHRRAPPSRAGTSLGRAGGISLPRRSPVTCPCHPAPLPYAHTPRPRPPTAPRENACAKSSAGVVKRGQEPPLAGRYPHYRKGKGEVEDALADGSSWPPVLSHPWPTAHRPPPKQPRPTPTIAIPDQHPPTAAPCHPSPSPSLLAPATDLLYPTSRSLPAHRHPTARMRPPCRLAGPLLGLGAGGVRELRSVGKLGREP